MCLHVKLMHSVHHELAVQFTFSMSCLDQHIIMM